MQRCSLSGAVLFAVLFIYTGDQAVRHSGDGGLHRRRCRFPTLLAPYTSQLETLTGMPLPQLLAIGVGGFEILAGLMIALNFLARFFSILLIFFVLATTSTPRFLWNQSPPDNAKT